MSSSQHSIAQRAIPVSWTIFVSCHLRFTLFYVRWVVELCLINIGTLHFHRVHILVYRILPIRVFDHSMRIIIHILLRLILLHHYHLRDINLNYQWDNLSFTTFLCVWCVVCVCDREIHIEKTVILNLSESFASQTNFWLLPSLFYKYWYCSCTDRHFRLYTGLLSIHFSVRTSFRKWMKI
jgi:hypothetical protein